MKNPGYLSFAKLFVLAFVLALASCSSPAEKPEEKVAAQEEEAQYLSQSQLDQEGIHLVQIQKSLMGNSLNLSGQILTSPSARFDVSSHFGGTVRQLHLQNGDRIQKGQVLFYLEGPALLDLQQNYLEEKARLDFLQADYERQEKLFQDSVVSEKVYRQALADFRVSQARFQSLKAKLDLLQVDLRQLHQKGIFERIAFRAPASGYLSQLTINEGYLLQANERAAVIINDREPVIELKVFEKDLGHVKVGQRIEYQIPSMADQRYFAEIVQISPDFTQAQGSALAYAKLSEGSVPKSIGTGMYVEAQVFEGERAVASLPETAVVEQNGHYFALSAKQLGGQYRLEKLELKIGMRQKGIVEIIGAKQYLDTVYFLDKGAFGLLGE
ncbi:efflux RND transporter periplasmic adaptor subunit [Croceimicrobium sp.]|uniref:efflux RND transporter periplasmic adaptor subunit n=1 Tax=Croceimicrobium sp. TaxID=2828340 RepID=UPI003BA844EA